MLTKNSHWIAVSYFDGGELWKLQIDLGNSWIGPVKRRDGFEPVAGYGNHSKAHHQF